MLAQGNEDSTKIAMRLGKVWLDLQGFGVAGYSLFRLPKGIEDIGLAPVSPDSQAVFVEALMNSRGERILSPECGWFSL